MYPSWLTVEYARTRLMSLATRPIVAANTAVMPPMSATTVMASDASNSGKNRATRNTPAVTMVAEWIRAETGVGPSMASGSQECRGNWADFPAAPMKNPRDIHVAAVTATAPAATASYRAGISSHAGFWVYR